MVVFVLYVKAELENIASIKLKEDVRWCMDVKQANSDEIREGVFVSAAEEHELTGSRGTANFVLKWPGSKKESYINVQEVKNLTRFVTGADSGQFVPIVGFECRGLEPIKWHPREDFIVESEGGALFEEVDLSDDWADYDEENDLSVCIQEIESKFEVHK